jgi:hypothetical protein
MMMWGGLWNNIIVTRIGGTMEFRLFEQIDYNETREKWSEEALERDFFPDEVDRHLRVVKDYLGGADDAQHRSLAYGVFNPGSHVAAGVCSLVLSDRGVANGKWLKLLDVRISPEASALLSEDDVDAAQCVVHVYKAAVNGAFEARLDHEADTLKLYGRNDSQLQFLTVLLAVIRDDDSSNIAAKRAGRWLVINTRER